MLLAFAGAHKLGTAGLLLPLAVVLTVIVVRRPVVMVTLAVGLAIVCEGPTFGLLHFTSHLYDQLQGPHATRRAGRARGGRGGSRPDAPRPIVASAGPAGAAAGAARARDDRGRGHGPRGRGEPAHDCGRRGRAGLSPVAADRNRQPRARAASGHRADGSPGCHCDRQGGVRADRGLRPLRRVDRRQRDPDLLRTRRQLADHDGPAGCRWRWLAARVRPPLWVLLG